jgi:facilitated trehalose transporter
VLQSFLRRPVLFPFGLSLALLGFQQVSGIDTVIFYTVEIFKTAESGIDEYLSTILIGVVQLVSERGDLDVCLSWDSEGKAHP